jgi:hypothetical protein
MGALYSQYRKWASRELSHEKGVVVGSDLTQEWLLPWWWDRYRRHNSYPVTFVDFGLSESMKQWCRERGDWVRLLVADFFAAGKNEVEPALAAEWEEAHGTQFWQHRAGWFKKPLACLLSPYPTSVWIDSDCEIRGSLEEIFRFCDHPSGIAVAREQNAPASQEGNLFNSGVIGFKKGTALMEEWADLAVDENRNFVGDQDILSWVIRQRRLGIAELPPVYNWSRCLEENSKAVVVHWHGRHGKTIIQHQISRERET